jgi:tetratricopeptide (TPR) repeat protein
MQIKCSSCGAAQNLNEGQNCGFCGSTIEMESAKSNYQNFMNGETGNLMAMADTAVEATNWEEALQYYNKVLEKDISNSDAWLGKGTAIVYTSKISDVKTKEAIAYWNNAIKHAENAEAMGKRVGKEINTVVSGFYPAIENHYIQFYSLDNSYQELVSRFATLENAQDYATQLDSTNIKLYETGYALCKRVIEIPNRHALSGEAVALAEGITGVLLQNKYKQQDAVQARRKAIARKSEIESQSLIVGQLAEKYFLGIESLDNDHSIVIKEKTRLIEDNQKQEKGKEISGKYKKHSPKFIYTGIIIYIIILVTTNFFEGVEQRGLVIFCGLLLFIITPGLLAEILVKKNILK